MLYGNSNALVVTVTFLYYGYLPFTLFAETDVIYMSLSECGGLFQPQDSIHFI